jgi:hypothetical protein
MMSIANSLGLSHDVTDLWEALPYSFVVDWFLPIQTFLEQFKPREVDPSWLLTLDAWYSVKTETKGYTVEEYTPRPASWIEVVESKNLLRFANWSASEYHRDKLVELPNGTASLYLPQPTWPSMTQSITGAELLIQRINRTLK